MTEVLPVPVDHVHTAFAAAAARVADGADPHAEAAMLVALMTPDERLGCLDGDVAFWPGLLDLAGGGYYRHTFPAARVPRLGIPGIEFADGPRGCVVGRATAFPVSMARGATFDPELEERVGEAIGRELRASGATYTGAVCMNLLRHPGWGRAQETYGEDPHHVGEMAAALTRGLQRHVLACMKHFALNSIENARFTVNVVADERTLHEVYLPHFRRVAAEGVASVMSAYNKVNGDWCGESRYLLTDVLRQEWGWDGFVTSDFIFGTRDAVASLRAGLDVEMPFRMHRARVLPEALTRGDIALDEIDAAARRVVTTLLRFADRLGGPAPDPAVIAGADHRELAYEAAVRSMVLLRNDGGLLPLDARRIGRVAVLGGLAAIENLGDGGSSDVHPPEVVTILDGLRAALGDDRVVVGPDDASAVAALDGALDGADVVLVVVGTTKHDEGEYIDMDGASLLSAALFPPLDDPIVGREAAPPEWTTEPTPPLTNDPLAGGSDAGMHPGGDRRSLRLPAADEALIAAAAARHERVVVAVMGGSAFVMPWVDTVAATVLVWYPGMEGGRAIADVLLGRDEPGGRLPFAIPVDESDLVAFDPDATEVVYDRFHGQWLLDRDGRDAAFPFGSGLGYRTATIAGAALGPGGEHVRVTLEAPDGPPSSTVLFVFGGRRPGSSPFDRPRRRLVGFARVALPTAGRASVAVPVDWSALAVRVGGAMLDEPGAYELEIGQQAHDPGAITLVVDRIATGPDRSDQ